MRDKIIKTLANSGAGEQLKDYYEDIKDRVCDVREDIGEFEDQKALRLAVNEVIDKYLIEPLNVLGQRHDKGNDNFE